MLYLLLKSIVTEDNRPTRVVKKTHLMWIDGERIHVFKLIQFWFYMFTCEGKAAGRGIDMQKYVFSAKYFDGANITA